MDLLYPVHKTTNYNMDLPCSYELNEWNRILIAVTELTAKAQGCSINSVAKLCSSFVFGGRPFDHTNILSICSYTGLLSIEKGEIVALTDLGEEFLRRNTDFSYEITDQQKAFIAEQIIFKGPWQSRMRDLFLSFTPNYSKVTYEMSLIENALPLQFESIIHLLKILNVLVEADNKLFVEPNYVGLVNQLLADRHGISEKQLLQVLEANRLLGKQAEEAVLRYEHRRLKALNRHAEAELIRRISELDAGRGYDIESFDGDKPLYDYDRFIEVKASQASELRFFWSANERRVAEEKGDHYWIYFVGSFRQSKSDEIIPIMIRNPGKRLYEIRQLNLEPATYVITQCDELPLDIIRQENVRGFVL